MSKIKKNKNSTANWRAFCKTRQTYIYTEEIEK